MSKITLLLCLLLSSFLTTAQVECGKVLECRIIARSGLLMRAKPNTSAPVVKSVPYDSMVTACHYTYGTLSYDGVEGHWRKVFHEGEEGYMFDGYLEIVKITESKADPKDSSLSLPPAVADITPDFTENPPPSKELAFQLLTEAYNYCGDVRSIDPGLRWYGVYPAEDQEPYGRIEEVELEIKLSREKFGDKLEFDIETDREYKSLFLIGLNQAIPLQTDLILDQQEPLRLINHRLYPGQQLRLGTSKNDPLLYATGSVTGAGDCPELKDYNLILKAEKPMADSGQNLNSLLRENGKCGMPELFWYGDLNGDDFPDMIFVSVKEEENIFTLLISDLSLPEGILRRETEWVIQNCY